jgi:DNA-binding CsgD family transcriptional regulator
MAQSDQIEIIEAAYALEAPHEAWQRRLTELIAGQWDGEGVSFVYDFTNPSELIQLCPVMLLSDEKRRAAEGVMSVPYPADVWRRIMTASHLVSVYEIMGPQAAENPVFEKPRVAAGPGFDPNWCSVALNTLDPSRRGLTFVLSERPITRRMRHVWGQLASHIGIAYRLRQTLDDLAPGATRESAGEAVVDLDGRCQHAEGEARSSTARELLREAARAVMRARGSLRSREPDEARDIWRGLIAGRWSLVDRFDSDGKHFLVAHRNPPEVRDQRALTAREAQVAAYLAMGLSNKLIGYTLGLGTSTVANHISSIGRKLGTPSRAELVRLLAALDLAPPTEPEHEATAES